MTDLNNVVIMGNLVKEPVTKSVGNASLTNITLALNRSVKKGDNWETETSFIDCVIWGKENTIKYLTKGGKVTVEGYLKQDRWEKDGQKNSKISVVVNNIYLCGNAKKNENSLTNDAGSGTVNTGSDFPEDVPF